MRLSLPLLLAALVLAGCGDASEPVVELVPADALTGLLPDAVGAFAAAGDEVYRGYFADSTGALALVTVARTYLRGAVMMTLNVSSMDRPDRYRALIEAGGARATPDSVVRADPALAAAAAAGWAPYDVTYGRLLLHPDGRAVEAKSMIRGVPAVALGAVDLTRLWALPEAPVTVDTTFVRAAPEPPAAPAASDRGGALG